MKTIVSVVLAFLFPVVLPAAGLAADSAVKVVAAENFYGEVVQQIGGSNVEVVSVMNNPDQDPHLFETSPSIVRQIVDAQIVIFNGADYDPWMAKLLAAAPRPQRGVIVVADLVSLGRTKGAGYRPVSCVTETIPPGIKFQDWMLGALDETEKALAGPSS